MADERKIQLLVIATIVRKAEGTKETHEFVIDWKGDNGPVAIQTAVAELEKLRGGPISETEWLGFLNVHPNKLHGAKHTVLISVEAKNQQNYCDLFQLEGYKTRQDLLKAAVDRLPATARGGTVVCFRVNPTDIDMSD